MSAMAVASLNDSYTLTNGVKMPCIGFGTWQMPDGDTAQRSVQIAIETGFTHIDTASAYGNEKSVGRAIRKSGVKRNSLFITTKLGNSYHGYRLAKEALEQSLENLGLEYLDLYLIHWPNPFCVRERWQEANAESWKAMEEYYRAGRIRALGVSNFHRHHLDALLKTAEIKPQVNQIRIAPGDYKDDVIRTSREHGLQLEAYSPLGGTSGTFGGTELLKAPLIGEIARKYGKTPAQICVRWCLEQDFLPLPKSTSLDHIKLNSDVFTFSLSKEEVKALSELSGFPDPFPHPDRTDF